MVGKFQRLRTFLLKCFFTHELHKLKNRSPKEIFLKKIPSFFFVYTN